jgi:integrase
MLPATQNPDQNVFLTAVMQSNLGERTKNEYTKAVSRMLAAGVHPTDTARFLEYAHTLPTSSRAFLRGAIGRWCNHIEQGAKAGATPDNVAVVQATLYRLDAIKNAVQTHKMTGQKSHQWLTVNETMRILELCDTRTNGGLRDRVLFALLFGAGLRRDELSKLTWGAIVRQGEQHALTVTGKGRKNRAIPITAELKILLDRWRAVIGTTADAEPILWLVNKSDTPQTAGISGGAIYLIVQEYGKKIGRDNLQPHDTRRTYAQRLLDSGVPIGQISKLMGHANEKTTELYLNVKIDGGQIRQALAGLA